MLALAGKPVILGISAPWVPGTPSSNDRPAAIPATLFVNRPVAVPSAVTITLKVQVAPPPMLP